MPSTKQALTIAIVALAAVAVAARVGPLNRLVFSSNQTSG